MYEQIANNISNSRQGIGKRIGIIAGIIIGIGSITIIVSEVFPEQSEKILFFLEKSRYLFASGVVGAMGGIIYKRRKKHR